MAFDKDTSGAVERTTVQIKGPAGSGLTTYTDLGCLIDDVEILRAWANEAETSGDTRWCDSGDAVAKLADYIAGEKTITSSILMEGVLGSAVYKFLDANDGEPFDIKFTIEDAKTPKTTQVREYKIVKTSDRLTMRGAKGATSRFSFDFQAIEILAETVTTAS